MVVKESIAMKEEKLKDLAKKAWAKSLKEFYYPPLDEPNFVFDYTHKEGFYIDSNSRWKITMNLANTPIILEEIKIIDYYHAIAMHEISHYQVIPYDGLINAKLLRAAMKYVNQNFAPIVLNIFADLYIDTLLFKKYPELMEWELKTTLKSITQKGKLSEFTEFLILNYEFLWDINIIDSKSISKLIELAKNVSNIVKENFYDESTWEKKVTLIAYHLQELIKDTFTLIGKFSECKKGSTKRKAPGKGENYLEISDDILEVMNNPLENRNKDKLDRNNKDALKEKAERFARDVPYSEFGAPASQAGILLDASPLATWYRGKAKNLIQIKIFEEKPGGEIPAYPEVWRIGDPIEQLDIVQSLLNSPVLIPNVTTRKWNLKEGPGILEEK
ncbi:MAG: hypothetical protein P8Y70_14100, partial [Candidatus Lokiarchaeota archaeon]